MTAGVENEGDFTGLISYEWSGPNGFVSTAQNPVIANASLSDAGTYTVLVTTSGECNGQASVEVEVYEVLPAASIDGPAIVCEGESFTLCTSSYADYPGGTFTISPPNSTSESSALDLDENGCVTINPGDDAYVSGIFTVNYSNAEGCESALGIPFDLSINPIPVVTATNDGPICEGEDVQLFAGTIADATYEWTSGGEIISTEQNPVIYGLEETTSYEVTATVDGCTSAPAVTTVIVHPIPEIITVLGGGTYCEGTDVTLASIVEDAGPGSTYTWTGPNGFEYSSIIGGNVTLPAVTEADAGVYTLVVTSAEGCESEPYSVTVDVIGQVEPIIVSSDSGCEGGEITLSIEGYEGTDVTYEWTTPNGTTENISGLNTNEIMIDPASASTHSGEYTVTVTANGCSLTSDPYYLDINESPQVEADATYNLTADCSFSDILLSTEVSGGTAPYSYEWTGPNGFESTLANPGIANATTDNNGTYTVVVTDANGCSATAQTEVLNIENPVDQPVITASETGCEGEEVVLSVPTYEGSNVSYDWNVPSTVNVSGLNTSTLTIDPSSASEHNGDYQVTINVDGCILESDVYNLVINPTPVVSNILGGDVYCEGSNVTLTAFVEGASVGSSYEWTGPNGLSHSGAVTGGAVSLEIPAITPSDAGTYTVVVTNENGCSSEPVSATVDVVPQTEPVISSTDSGCEGSTIVMSVPAYDGVSVSYTWTTPNGVTENISGLNTNEIMIDPANADLHNGDYTVTITVDDCVLTSVPYNLVINDAPVVSANAIYNLNEDCSFSDILLSTDVSSGAAPYSYEWTGPNGFESTLANPGIANATTDNNGTYTVVVTDANGCSATAQTEVLDIENPVDQPVITASETGCEGEEVVLSVPTYDGSDVNYVWDIPSTVNVSGLNTSTLTIDPSSAAEHNGAYSVTVTVDGCVLESDVYNLVINPTPVVVSILGGDVYCEGSDVTLTAIIEGATAGSTFTWTGPNGLDYSGALGTASTVPLNIPLISPEDAGVYTLVITNENGCSSEPYSTSVEVVPQTEPVISSTDSGCEGGTVVMSVPAYDGSSVSYTWTTPNGVTENISGLNTNEIMIDPASAALHNGDYTVTIAVDGCVLTSAPYNLDINESPEVSALSAYTLNEDCSLSDIELNSGVTGGTAPYSYAWTGPNGFESTLANPSIANATTDANGTYTVVVTDANGCSGTGQTEVLNIEDPVDQPVITASETGCEGEDVTMSVTTYAGSDVNYVWTVPSTTNVSGLNTSTLTIDPSSASEHNGGYSVTVTVDGCVLTSDVYNLVINDSPVATPTADYSLNGDCSYSDVLLAANASGGTAPYTYEWTGPNGFESSLASPGIANATTDNNGTYTVVVTDANGCSTTAGVEVLTIEDPVDQPVITASGIGCEGGDVSLSIDAYEGSSVTYTWTTPNGVTDNISGLHTNALTISPADAGLHSGDYSVTVNVDGCILTSDVFNLDINASPIVVALTGSGVYCEGDDVTFATIVSGADNGGTYEWNGPDGFSASGELIAGQSPAVTIPSVHAGQSGTYTLTITNADGCSTSVTAIIKVIDQEQPVITASDSGCEGGEVTLSIPAIEGESVTYTWTTPNGTTENISGLSSNAITIDPTDAAIHSGTYTVTVSTSGCELSASYELDINASPEADPTAVYNLNADCSYSDILLAANASGGTAPYSYAWTGPNGFESSLASPGIANATTDANGTYTVVVTDANGCSTTAGVEVLNVEDPQAAPVIQSSGIGCAGDIVTLSVPVYEGSSVSYEWSTPNGLTIDMSGINTNELTINPVSATLHSGAYSVTVTVDDCVLVSSEYILDVNPAPTVTPEASYTLNADCSLGDLQLTANATGIPPLTYEWSGPNGFSSNAENPTIVNATASNNGVYTVVVTDAAGCTSEASTNVIDNISDPVAEPVISATDTGCEGGEISLSVTPYEGSSVSYTWTTPNGTTLNISGLNTNTITIDPASAAVHNGPYTVTVVVDGCTLTSDVYNLNILPAPAPAGLTGGGTYCEGTDALLSASGLNAGMEYTWTGPNGFTYSGIVPAGGGAPDVFLPSVSESDAGVYTLTLVSAQGCESAAASLIIDVIGQPATPELEANDVELCEGDVLELSVPSIDGAVSYEWYYSAGAMGTPFAVTSTPNVLVTDAATLADAGAYTVVAIGANGCASSPSNFVTVYVEAIPDTPTNTVDLTVCEGESIPAGSGLYATCVTGAMTQSETVSLVSDEDVPIGFNDSEDYGDGSMSFPGPVYSPAMTPIIPAGATITSVTVEIVLTTMGNSCESDMMLEVVDPMGGTQSFTPFTTCNGTAGNNYTATITYSPNTTTSAATVGEWSVNFKDMDDQNAGADEFWARYGVLTYEYSIETDGSDGGAMTWWDAETGGTQVGQGDVYTPGDDVTSTPGVHTYWAQCGDVCPSERVPVTLTVVPAPPAPAVEFTNAPLCLGEEAILCISTSVDDIPGAVSIDYTFIPPSGSTSESSTTTNGDGCVAVTEAGEWTAYYTVTYADGLTCESAVSAPVEVEFTALDEPVITSSGPTCEGGTIVLTIPTYSGNMTGYLWTYEGGPAGDLDNVTGENTNQLVISPVNSGHEGAYSVIVTVDGCSVSSDIYNLDVFDSATLAPGFTAPDNCEGGTLELFANADGAGAGATYFWTGPNGWTSNAENPIIPNADINDNGTYTVTVTTVSGCSVSGSVTVNIITDTPTTPSIAAAADSVCEGEDINLSVPQPYPAGTVYTWLDGTGAVISSGTASAISIASGTAQPFSVYVTVGTCISEVSDLATVTVNPAPIASATNNGPVCVGDDVTLFGGPIAAGGTYEWTDADGNLVSTAQNPVIYNIQGTTTYNLTVYAAGCPSATVSTTVEVDTTDPAVNPQDVIICEGESIPEGQGLFAECFAGDLVTIYDTIQLVSDEDIFIGTMDTESYADNPPLVFADPGVPVGTQITGVQARLFFRIEGVSCESDIDIRITDPLGNVTEFLSYFSGCAGNNGNALYEFNEMLSSAGLAGSSSGNWVIELRDSNDNNPISAGSPGNSAPAGTEYSVRFGDIQYMTELVTGTSGNITWWDASAGGNMVGIDAPFTPENTEDLDAGVYTFWAECGNPESCHSDERVPVRLIVNEAPATPTLIVEAACAGGPLVLRTDATCDTYYWVGPEGMGPITSVFEATVAPTGTFYNEGLWYVVCEDAQGCTSESAAVEVTFDELSAPVITNTTTGGSVCEGEQIQFFTQTPGSEYSTGAAVTFTWYFNGSPWIMNGNPVTDQNPVIPSASMANNGVYYVIATVDGTCNSAPSNSTIVSVTEGPDTPEASVTTPICEGGSVELNTPFIAGAEYQWYGPAGFESELMNPIIPVASLVNGGEYYVYVTINGCSSELSAPAVLTVNAIPDTPTAANNGPACVGSDVDLMVMDPVPGATYTWYSATTNTMLGLGSTVTLSDLTMADAGMYYVLAEVGGCTSAFGETELIVDEIMTGNMANAGDDQALCGSSTATLSATAPSIGSGVWTSPTGATIANPDAADSDVSDLIEGENIFIWTLNNGACGGLDSDMVIIVVTDVVEEVAFAGLNEEHCQTEVISLSATAVATEGVAGTWTQPEAQANMGVVIDNPTDPNTTVSGLLSGVPSASYEFTWTLSNGACGDFSASTVTMTNYYLPEDDAYAGENFYACDAMTELNGAVPTVGEGMWTQSDEQAASGVEIVSDASGTTMVTGLQEGVNTFTWSLYNGACGGDNAEGYSYDDIVITVQGDITATDDQVTINRGDQLMGYDVAANDDLSGLYGGDYIITVTQELTGAQGMGSLTNNGDGSFNYIPTPGFYGTVEFSYSICSASCSDLCTEAKVVVEVMAPFACEIPNVFTPNGDGMNDNFEIPCLGNDEFSRNSLIVFNRWGDQVYETTNYANTWQGTYNGDDLPEGTYYYILTFDQGTQEPMQGFIMIQR